MDGKAYAGDDCTHFEGVVSESSKRGLFVCYAMLPTIRFRLRKYGLVDVGYNRVECSEVESDKGEGRRLRGALPLYHLGCPFRHPARADRKSSPQLAFLEILLSTRQPALRNLLCQHLVWISRLSQFTTMQPVKKSFCGSADENRESLTIFDAGSRHSVFLSDRPVASTANHQPPSSCHFPQDSNLDLTLVAGEEPPEASGYAFQELVETCGCAESQSQRLCDNDSLLKDAAVGRLGAKREAAGHAPLDPGTHRALLRPGASLAAADMDNWQEGAACQVQSRPP